MDPIARLIAIEDIKQLKARYFRAVDMRQWDDLVDVFTADAIFDWSDGMKVAPIGGELQGMDGFVVHGRDKFIVWVSEAYANLTGAHYGHAHEIMFDGPTEARGIVSLEDYVFAPDRRTEMYHSGGYYHEVYRVVDGAWRIVEMKLTRLFMQAK